ncbi:hypothetical protein DFH06DRAFT_933098, partial [Mycena polygramma]
FGVAKRRFGIFTRAPEYPIEMQAMLVPAVGALHNFLRIHDRSDEAKDLGGDGTPATSTLDDFACNEPRQIQPEELGFQIGEAERMRASSRRDHIAEKMWQDYQAYIAQHGGDD